MQLIARGHAFPGHRRRVVFQHGGRTPSGNLDRSSDGMRRSKAMTGTRTSRRIRRSNPLGKDSGVEVASSLESRWYALGRAFVASTVVVTWLSTLAMFSAPALAQDKALPVGSPMPDVPVQLVDTQGASHLVTDLMGEEVTVFLFWSNQCPWVDRYDARIQELSARFRNDGVQFVLVNSNPTDEYPQESMEVCTSRKAEVGYPMPYVKDRAARLATALGASRAPHAFVFDGNRLVYTGAIDDSPASGDNVEAEYLRDAVDAALAGGDVPVSTTKPFGCSLKYPRSGS